MSAGLAALEERAKAASRLGWTLLIVERPEWTGWQWNNAHTGINVTGGTTAHGREWALLFALEQIGGLSPNK